MQKISKEEKAKRELQERLKKSAQKHAPSPLDSNPLIAQARAMLKPNFGIGSSADQVRSDGSLKIESSKREIQGAESGLSRIELERGSDARETKLATKELATKELATKELATKELATKELATKELATKELATKELATKELATKELATKELATKELATKELATKELATKELARKKLAAQVERSPSSVDTPQSNWIEEASRLFTLCEFSQDFSKDEEWVQGFLLKALGMKKYLAIELYLEIYRRCQTNGLEVQSLTRHELAKILQTNSNSSVSRAIKSAQEAQIMEYATLTCRKGLLNSGTYFRLMFPWKHKVINDSKSNEMS